MSITFDGLAEQYGRDMAWRILEMAEDVAARIDQKRHILTTPEDRLTLAMDKLNGITEGQFVTLIASYCA